MKTRFPLYLKILLWFFLNVAFLCVAFFIVARVEFRFGLDSLISGPAGESLQNVSRLVTTELVTGPRNEWNDALKGFGDDHGVKFYLFHNVRDQLEQLAGETVDLPSSVRDRMMARRGMSPFERSEQLGPPPGPRGPDQEPPPEQRPDNPDFQPPPSRQDGPHMQRDGPPPDS